MNILALFAGNSARSNPPVMDTVIAVCGNAARET
ncbi:hypothetical protein BDE40_1122 [Litoreibacter halocynthiae]|uniref:Uncharacterized protein n=1 Tax=Litoreibacter halocynthiae TaxID=1242689 RepID=A0A4R7LP13_9RHOB|nr:hypothetical protein BDE40_1122 [Litoreibacter halocynthiae]